MTNSSGSTPEATTGAESDTNKEGSIDTDNTGNNATDLNNRNDSTINIRTGESNGQDSRSNLMVDTSNKAFKGVEPDIRCVLGMRFEKWTRN